MNNNEQQLTTEERVTETLKTDARLWKMLLHEEWLDAAAFLKSPETSLAEKAHAVNYINTDGCSTLLLAALHGAHLSLLQQILNIGNVDILLKGTAGSGWTPLIIACDRYDHTQAGKDHLDFIQLLINVGGKDLVCRVDGSRRTALHWACDRVTPYPEVIGPLIQCGGKELLVKLDCDNNTALHQICMQQQPTPPKEVIQLMIKAGGRDVCRAKNNKGETALHLYCRVKHPHIVVVEEMILVGGKDMLNWTDSKEHKPYDNLVNNDHIDHDTKELWRRLINPGHAILPLKSKTLSDASVQAIQMQIHKLETLVTEQHAQLIQRLEHMETIMMTKHGTKRDVDTASAGNSTSTTDSPSSSSAFKSQKKMCS